MKKCRDLYSLPASSPEKVNFFHTDHISNVLGSAKRLLIETQDDLSSEGVKQNLPQYLKILEICHYSLYNRKKSIKREIPEILINIICKGRDLLEMRVKRSVYYLSQVCFSQLLEQENLVKKCVDIPKFAKWISTSLDSKPDNCIELLPTFKILQSAFQSVTVTEIILRHNYGIIKDLIKITKTSKMENDVLLMNVKVSFYSLYLGF